MNGVLEAISLSVDQWKSKGLTPTTLKVGPDVQQELITHFTHLPDTLLNLTVVPIRDPGFFVTGPWYSQPPMMERKK